MDGEKVVYEKREIVEILRYLNQIVVSLDRIGSSYCDCKSEEEYHALSSNFLDDWKVLHKLAKARSVLSEPFSYELGEDDMDELERELQDLQYWSRLKPLSDEVFEVDEDGYTII